MSAKTEMLTKIEFAAARLMLSRARSAWGRGVNDYAVDLLDDLKEAVAGEWVKPETLKDWKGLRSALLNGAPDWSAYSWGGFALIYDDDIAKRLCNPTEYKRTRGGERRPNAREEWLDVQARALRQAAAVAAREMGVK